MSWQLTKSTSIDEVESILSDLSKKIDTTKEELTIFVDNCCQVRNKLVSVFGSGVKLDVFHAVQRITRAISKKHVLSCLYYGFEDGF